jgi:hypothetical protein
MRANDRSLTFFLDFGHLLLHLESGSSLSVEVTERLISVPDLAVKQVQVKIANY